MSSLALPPNVRAAVANSPRHGGRGSLQDIKHVVMLMQENRNFDHYFGGELATERVAPVALRPVRQNASALSR